MAKRSSLSQQVIRAQIQAQREAERARKARERARAVQERERKRSYLESRVAEVEAENANLEQAVSSLHAILHATLGVDDYLDIDDLKLEPDLPVFQPGALAVEAPAPAKVEVAPLSWGTEARPRREG